MRRWLLGGQYITATCYISATIASVISYRTTVPLGHFLLRLGLRSTRGSFFERSRNRGLVLPVKIARRMTIDGRSVTARRYRDILPALSSDMGGVENMTEARTQLCRRFAAVAVQAEQ